MTDSSALQQMRARVVHPGHVEWLGLRPQRRAEVIALQRAELLLGIGIRGDHGKEAMPRLRAITGGVVGEAPPPSTPPERSGGQGKRQVTLIQAEHLPVIAALCGLQQVTPQQLRRNVVVSGLPLRALIGRPFWLGSALLEGTGECHPCSRMEENLGPGGYNAVRGHGGITARVLQGGVVTVSDKVQVIDG